MWAVLLDDQGKEFPGMPRAKGYKTKRPNVYQFNWDVPYRIARHWVCSAAAYMDEHGGHLGTKPILPRVGCKDYEKGDMITLEWEIKITGDLIPERRQRIPEPWGAYIS